MGAGTNGAFFRKAKEHFANGDIDWVSDTLRVALFRTDAETVHAFKVTGVTDVGSGSDRCRVDFGTAHSWSAGDYVHVFGIEGATEANGTWKIAAVATNTIDLEGSAAPSTYSTGDDDGFVVNLTDPDVVTDFQTNVIHETVVVGTSVRTATGGELNMDDVTFTNAGSSGGQDCEGLLVYVDGATDYVVALVTEGTGLTRKITTNGGNVNVTWAAYILGL